MPPLSLRSLILTVSVAVLATFTAAAPIPTPSPEDPCRVLGSKDQGITYDEVAACYQYIPYDANVAVSTLKTVHTLFDEFYVFRDSALTPNLAHPFTSGPVDIVDELNKIGQTDYQNDYQFHSALVKVIDSLNDAHAAYAVDCYAAYHFAQALTLYAPVIEGQQSIRVFIDLEKRGYDDCEVLTIDGQEAFPYIRAFAETIGFSKDSGVRLNQALASYIYDQERGEFVLSSGRFSERVTLPGKGSLTYELQCANSPTPVTVEDGWLVIKQTQSSFTDYESYLSNVCHAPNSADSQNHALFNPVKQPLITMPKKSVLLELLDDESTPEESPYGFPDAPYIGSGNATVYYQLKNFQGNGGGSVAFASLLVQAFFPNKDPLEKSLPSDLRVSKSIQDLSTAVFNTGNGGRYNAAYYVDVQTGSPYSSNSLFYDVVTLTRNGRQAVYSKTTTLYPRISPKYSQLATYPWTANADHITILTDGRCGSACALSTHYFTLHDVPAYAIGGYQGQDLSMFSFPGGAVSSLNDLNSIYSDANVASPMENLPYEGDVYLPILEIYAKGASVPMEYDPSQYTASFHLDRTLEAAKSCGNRLLILLGYKLIS
ncbi:hypothetical protein BGZ65_011752 [Modicella reniformis]|uniref:Tail specific protease domain-containing protein n=1 Tax=Modicella reniformis TaxID=1440133 RepID=A0A9P6MJN3_9FUNG|nr:hypothetical protein BGZ65_011752 [Modicella reniformis]